MALEAQRGIESRLHEHLAQSDVGVVRLRRYFQQELARQRAVYAGAADATPAAAGEPPRPAAAVAGASDGRELPAAVAAG